MKRVQVGQIWLELVGGLANITKLDYRVRVVKIHQFVTERFIELVYVVDGTIYGLAPEFEFYSGFRFVSDK